MVGFIGQMESSNHVVVTSEGDKNDSNSVTDGKETSGAGNDDQQTGEPSTQTGDTVSEPEDESKKLKGILKQRGQYCMRKVKVDFDLIPTRIPFDETNDYTVEIKIIDKEPIKIKSWAAIFAARKAEAEAEAAAQKEADEALKKAEEVQKREAEKKANKVKEPKTEAIAHDDRVDQGEQVVSNLETKLDEESEGEGQSLVDSQSPKQPTIEETSAEDEGSSARPSAEQASEQLSLEDGDSPQQPPPGEAFPQQLTEDSASPEEQTEIQPQHLHSDSEASPSDAADSPDVTYFAENEVYHGIESVVLVQDEDTALRREVDTEDAVPVVDDDDVVVLSGMNILDEKKVPRSVLVRASSIIEDILEGVPSILSHALGFSKTEKPSNHNEAEATVVTPALKDRQDCNGQPHCQSARDGKEGFGAIPPEEAAESELIATAEPSSAPLYDLTATDAAQLDDDEEPVDFEKFKKQRDSIFIRRANSIKEASPELRDTAASILEEIELLSAAVVANVTAIVP